MAASGIGKPFLLYTRANPGPGALDRAVRFCPFPKLNQGQEQAATAAVRQSSVLEWALIRARSRHQTRENDDGDENPNSRNDSRPNAFKLSDSLGKFSNG